MQPRVIRAYQADFVPQDFDGTNKSGVRPVGDRVILLPDQPADQSAGGLFLTDDMQERLRLSAISGTIVELGDDAFAWNSDRTRPFTGVKPKPGDRVYFEKFAGSEVNGDDGKIYRICDDKCIGAVRPQH